jgi:hypothetical protein
MLINMIKLLIIISVLVNTVNAFHGGVAARGVTGVRHNQIDWQKATG